MALNFDNSPIFGGSSPHARQFAYRFPLPPRIDFDDARRRALLACYEAALKDGLFPIARPTATFNGGDGYLTFGADRPYLDVKVLCAP